MSRITRILARTLFNSAKNGTKYLNKSNLSDNLTQNQFFFDKRLMHSAHLKCWKCGIERKKISELFCNECKIIQEPENAQNYFKLLQIDETFDLNSKELQNKYRKMQTLLHPDKFSNRSIEEKRISEDYSSLVNKAYDILQSPLKRAVHLLNLKGETIQENERIDDKDLLMEIMELNERVEQVSTPEELKNLNKENNLALKHLNDKLSENFKQNNLLEVKKLIIKMRYYDSVSSHINSILRERGIVD